MNQNIYNPAKEVICQKWIYLKRLFIISGCNGAGKTTAY